MAEEPREGWRSDPYRRHALRYWDGLAWTSHVNDGGETGDDPVFPIPALETDARDYLAVPRPRRRPLLRPGPRPRLRRVASTHRAAAWAIVGFLGVVALAAVSARHGGSSPGGTARSPRVAEVEAAAAQVPPSVTAALAGLAVRPADRRPFAPYPARPGDGHDGCAPEQVVLRRDLVEVTLAPDGCTVRTGLLRDPATGRTVGYLRDRGAPPQVLVDRAVTPQAAWRTGAAGRTPTERAAMIDDPLNLLAVPAETPETPETPGTSGVESSADAAGRLPVTRTYRCESAARRIAVKVRYDLWVTPDELTALRTVLATCPDRSLPS